MLKSTVDADVRKCCSAIFGRLGLKERSGKTIMRCHRGKLHKIISTSVDGQKLRWKCDTYTSIIKHYYYTVYHDQSFPYPQRGFIPWPCCPLLKCQIEALLTCLLQDMHTRDPGIYRSHDGENRDEEQVNFVKVVWEAGHHRTTTLFWHEETFFMCICTFSVYCTTINRPSLVVPDFFLLVTKDFQSVLEGTKTGIGQIERKLRATSWSTLY